MSWVAWDKMCMAKGKEGLGVKDLERFNTTMLGKWAWWLLTGEECLWRKVVVEKYGPLELEGSISVSEGRG